MIDIKLTKSEVENLLSFFEFEFIPSIQRDGEVDNINYLVEMCDIYKKLQEALKGGANNV